MTPHGSHHAGDRVHRVVVAGAAEERQSAGQGKPARVIGRKVQPIADVEHGNREATVEVEKRYIFTSYTRYLDRAATGEDGGGAPRQVLPLHHRALLHIGPAVEVHESIVRHAEL